MTQQFKLVPIEPTDEMIKATENIEILTGHGDDAVFIDIFEAEKIYKAMLSAAPDVAGEVAAYGYENRAGIISDIHSAQFANKHDADHTAWPVALFRTPQPDRSAELEQILQDPENQPSQYGTIPISMYESRTAELQEQVLQLQDKVKRLEDELAVKTDEADGLRKLYELLIKECYSLDQEEYEDDGEYRFKWASLAIEQAKTKLTKLEKVNIDLEADKARLVEALRMWDETIKHQYTGSSQAMSYLQECAFVTQKLLAEINETSGFIGGDKC